MTFVEERVEPEVRFRVLLLLLAPGPSDVLRALQLHGPRRQDHHGLVRGALARRRRRLQPAEGRRRLPTVHGTGRRLPIQLLVLYGQPAAGEGAEVVAAVIRLVGHILRVVVDGVFVTGNALGSGGLFLRLRLRLRGGEVERVPEVSLALADEGNVVVAQTSGVVLLTAAAVAAADAAVAVVVVVDEGLVDL